MKSLPQWVLLGGMLLGGYLIGMMQFKLDDVSAERDERKDRSEGKRGELSGVFREEVKSGMGNRNHAKMTGVEQSKQVRDLLLEHAYTGGSDVVLQDIILTIWNAEPVEFPGLFEELTKPDNISMPIIFALVRRWAQFDPVEVLDRLREMERDARVIKWAEKDINYLRGVICLEMLDHDVDRAFDLYAGYCDEFQDTLSHQHKGKNANELNTEFFAKLARIDIEKAMSTALSESGLESIGMLIGVVLGAVQDGQVEGVLESLDSLDKLEQLTVISSTCQIWTRYEPQKAMKWFRSLDSKHQECFEDAFMKTYNRWK